MTNLKICRIFDKERNVHNAFVDVVGKSEREIRHFAPLNFACAEHLTVI